MTSPEALPRARTRIKICGLTREADVDAAVDAGADAVGFVLYAPSARAVTPRRAAELAGRLPPFVTPVLLFVNEDVSAVREALEHVPGAMAQFHGDETPDLCARACGDGRHRFLRAARIPLGAAGAAFDLVKYAADFHHAQAILLDAHVEGFGGGGKAFDWSLLPHVANARLVLSGGLSPANVGDGIRALGPRCRSLAVDVSSGVELSTKGVKSAEKIRQFVAAVRAADATAP
ncbi:MAG: phosphoribosylanthranilate isomerase [Comamonadaceae bacterium]|nr:MAG: phosphoribosylanthranilate isomerase [Comamonadaceae bacterium]